MSRRPAEDLPGCCSCPSGFVGGVREYGHAGDPAARPAVRVCAAQSLARGKRGQRVHHFQDRWGRTVRFGKDDRLGCFPFDFGEDFAGRRAGESVDSLSQISGVCGPLMADPLDHPQLLRREVLEFVDDHGGEVAAVQVCDGVVLEDQLGESRKVIVGEAGSQRSAAPRWRRRLRRLALSARPSLLHHPRAAA